MVGSTSLSFFELVVVGDQIEHGMRNGKIAVVAGTSSNNPKKLSRGFPEKKEGETNAVSIGQEISHPRRRQ